MTPPAVSRPRRAASRRAQQSLPSRRMPPGRRPARPRRRRRPRRVMTCRLLAVGVSLSSCWTWDARRAAAEHESCRSPCAPCDGSVVALNWSFRAPRLARLTVIESRRRCEWSRRRWWSHGGVSVRLARSHCVRRRRLALTFSCLGIFLFCFEWVSRSFLCLVASLVMMFVRN